LIIQEIHNLAENFANAVTIDCTEQQALEATKDKEKATTDAAQKELIQALTTQVEAIAKQNQ
jgi:hypothetical protein